MELTIQERHERCLYPCVRIRTPKALGSGTILHVHPVDDGLFDWYVLTNEHVVDNLIEISKKWNPVLRKEAMKDTLGQPYIEIFTYTYSSRSVGASSLQGEIVAYDKEEDLALLRVRAPYAHKHTASLVPRKEVNELASFEPVWTIGCGLGEKPVITRGYLSAFGCEIENKDYMMVTAASTFGNSGGATFLERSGEMIGVPARIAVAPLGFSNDVMTHMGFAITAERVYHFLDEHVFDFVYGSGRAPDVCHQEREEMRQRDLEKRRAENGD